MTVSEPSPAVPSFEALNASLASYLDTLIPAKFHRTSQNPIASSSTTSTLSLPNRNPFDAAGIASAGSNIIRESLIARPGAVDSRGRLLYAKPLTADEIMAEMGAKQRDRRNTEIAKSKAAKLASTSSPHSAMLKRKISEAQASQAQAKAGSDLQAGEDRNGDGNALAGPSTRPTPSSEMTDELAVRPGSRKQSKGGKEADLGSESEEEEESRTKSVGKKKVQMGLMGNGKKGKKKDKGKGKVERARQDPGAGKGEGAAEDFSAVSGKATVTPTTNGPAPSNKASSSTKSSKEKPSNPSADIPIISATISSENTTSNDISKPSMPHITSSKAIPKDFTFGTPAPPTKPPATATPKIASYPKPNPSSQKSSAVQNAHQGHKRKASDLSSGTAEKDDQEEHELDHGGDETSNAKANGKEVASQNGKAEGDPELAGLRGNARKKMKKRLKRARSKGEKEKE